MKQTARPSSRAQAANDLAACPIGAMELSFGKHPERPQYPAVDEPSYQYVAAESVIPVPSSKAQVTR